MSDWGDAFNRALARGEDHAAAAMVADDAEAREKRRFLRRLWNASLLLEIADARARGDFYVDANGLGYVLRLREWLDRAHERDGYMQQRLPAGA